MQRSRKIRDIWNGAKEKKCRARKTLKHEALVAKIGVDTVENELEIHIVENELENEK